MRCFGGIVVWHLYRYFGIDILGLKGQYIKWF